MRKLRDPAVFPGLRQSLSVKVCECAGVPVSGTNRDWTAVRCSCPALKVLDRILADAITQAGKVALAKFVLRGRENLVLVRSAQNGLMLHAMYFADEVRSFDEISKGESAKITDAETNLAIRLIDELSNEQFNPGQYEDEYRQRVLDLVNSKAEGKEITVAEPQAQRAQVIDLMQALKESLGKKVAKEKKPAVRAKSV